MTIDEIQKAIYKADLSLRPKIIFVNPLDAAVIRDTVPEIEDKIVLKESEFIEKGKAYVIDRKWANNAFGYTWSELE